MNDRAPRATKAAAKTAPKAQPDTIAAALELHRKGQAAPAQAMCERILAQEPAQAATQAEALHLLGIIAYQRKDLDGAAALIGRAIAANPAGSIFHSNLGNVLKDQGKPAEAEAAYRRAIALRPELAEAHLNLGAVLMDQAKHAEAEAAYRHALALRPDFAEAHNNLGTVLRTTGRREDAAAAYRRALALRPDFAAALTGLSGTLDDLGRGGEMEAAYRAAVAARPESSDALNGLAGLLKKQGRLAEAEAAYRRLIALRPKSADAWNNLGAALQSLGRLPEAAEAYRQAIALRPKFPWARNNLANALKDMGRLQEAEAEYHAAIAEKPGFAEAYSNLGATLQLQGRLEEAVEAYRRAIKLKPDFPWAHNNLANVLKDQGRLAEAMAVYRRALELGPDLTLIRSNYLFSMNYRSDLGPAVIFAAHREWGRRHAPPPGAVAPHANDRDPARRLRVGYVSPDLRWHPVSYFFTPLVTLHDRKAVEIFCYAEVTNPDDLTEKLKTLADHWVSTVGLSPQAMAERIRADRIDILVDLAGHTGKNRLATFALEPAPVQVSWLGYPNTTGVPQIGYRFSDAIVDPPGESDALSTETIVRLPNGFHCYGPVGHAGAVAPPPFEANGHVTFGSFNNLSKVTPEVVATWAKVLEAVPRSRFLMKGKQFSDAPTRERYIELFADHGIARDRVETVARTVSHADHFAGYGRMDIALDPFPYNGTTTTCDALWMGVPVVTLIGERHAARVGASLLTRIGLEALIAKTERDYVAIAVALAEDRAQLEGLRASLRARMSRSPLCDAKGFARDVEAAYRAMWRAWRTGG